MMNQLNTGFRYKIFSDICAVISKPTIPITEKNKGSRKRNTPSLKKGNNTGRNIQHKPPITVVHAACFNTNQHSRKGEKWILQQRVNLIRTINPHSQNSADIIAIITLNTPNLI